MNENPGMLKGEESVGGSQDKGSAPLSVPGEQRIIIFAVEALQYQDLRSSLEHETHRPGQAGRLSGSLFSQVEKIVINLDLKTQISVLL